MSKLITGDWFLVGIMCLQLCAAVSYAWKRQWLVAALYLAYMVAQGLLILLAIRGRG